MKKVTPSLLRRFPLPRLAEDADKQDRGVALVIGGSRQLPGTILLSGLAALRAGAGKLQFGAPREIAIPLGVAAPEALVATGRMITSFAKTANAVLIGPGMDVAPSTVAAARRYARAMQRDATLILDASALRAAGERARTIITPHPGEIAKFMSLEENDVKQNAPDIALAASEQFGCVVALKSDTTYIASDGEVYEYNGGTVGLATSGSGDTLAGVVTGLSARGADPLTATLWSVWAHGTAGGRLARRVGRTGFLARELLDELPKLLSS
jgi:hydroxyethylthiazole kinase-like uncharacterized protein yjeF